MILQSTEKGNILWSRGEAGFSGLGKKQDSLVEERSRILGSRKEKLDSLVEKRSRNLAEEGNKIPW